MTRNEQFINKLKGLFGNTLDYSKVEYVDYVTPVKLYCYKHELDFEKKPDILVKGVGCPLCGKEKFRKSREKNKLSKHDEFIAKCKEKHGDKYDYTDTRYLGSSKPITFKCNSCGNDVTVARAYTHITNGYGCRNCTIKGMTKTTEDFIKEAREKHGSRYDYSKTNYQGANKKVTITCPLHGDFQMFPIQHISKTDHGNCPKCGSEDRFELNVAIAKKVHNNKYTYPQQEYNGYRTPIEIICPIHGKFYQSFNNHNAGRGCYICGREPSNGEKKLEEVFDKYNIMYIREYNFGEEKLRYRYDFYLPELNVLVEYDGAHHFKPIDAWGGYKQLEVFIRRDNDKNRLAKERNIPLIRIPYTRFYQIEEYFLYRLSKIYRYKYNGKYYKDTKDLINSTGVSLDELKPLKNHLVYNKEE